MVEFYTMVSRIDLIAYIDDLLKPEQFRDYCPNGLQVAGREQIHTVVSGVTASQALIDAAIEHNADMLLVHHGYFWRGEQPCVIGIKQQRLKSLLQQDINLVAYHLPLDAHSEFGNNTQLARLLGIEIDGTIPGTGDPALAQYGCLPQQLRLAELGALLRQTLQHEPLLIQGHDRVVQRIGWCTGAAQGYIEQAAAMGLDAFISGEISEQTVHLARELGINYIAAGHHATERGGVQALGQHLAHQFAIDHVFVDIDNPV
jgi:dinuclear metal center YbgI/SA1388 family protein